MIPPTPREIELVSQLREIIDDLRANEKDKPHLWKTALWNVNLSSQSLRMSIPFYFCFDVESIGLHGEAFAVGWVVVNRDGDMCFEGLLAVDPAKAVGDDSDRVWVNEHVPPIEANCKSYDFFREEFWRIWLHWKEKGAVMVADCAWPVEANFLRQCILYDTEERRFQGPYPLHNLASIRLAKGEEPTGDYDRIKGELPQHNPLCDARQTARHLIKLLKPPLNMDNTPIEQISEFDSVRGNPVAESKYIRQRLDKTLLELKSFGIGGTKARSSRERSLAITKIQEGIMWLGMDLKAIDEANPGAAPNPYPKSYDPKSPSWNQPQTG